MSISGRLDDVSIAEVMQFIHLGRRSGVLQVEGPGKAEIRFSSGRIVAANGDSVQRLGGLLVRRGLITPGTLLTAVKRQREEGGERVLGQVLVSMGAVRREALTRVVEEHIQEAVRNVLTWRRGTFSFELGDVEPIHGFERSLGELLPSVNLNTQRVLLEAARILDESRRDEARPPEGEVEEGEEGEERSEEVETLFVADPAAAGGGEEGRPPASAEPRGDGGVFIASADDDFVGRLGARLNRESLRLERLPPRGAPPPRNGSRPLVLIDASAPSPAMSVERIRESSPGARPVALVDPETLEDYATALGADAILDRDPEAVAAYCRDRGAGQTSAADRSPERARQALLRRLRGLSREIRGGALSANATLALLDALAECSERSVLFMVRDRALEAIGGFGFSTVNGRPVVEVTRGLSLPLDRRNVLVEAVSRLEARELRLDEEPLPEPFAGQIGPPESGQSVLLPVAGTEGVILLVYADNGSRPVEELDLLALAADQVGVAIENELLRHRLAHS